MSIVAEHFLGRLLTVYGAPKSDNREALLAEYDRILGKYSADELAAGADRLLETHKFRTWPAIADCVNACENARSAKDGTGRSISSAIDYIEAADLKARFFVNGSTKNLKTGEEEPRSAHWSARFLAHSLVQLAEAEGWSRDLRGHVIFVARKRLMRGETLGDVGELMPDAKWVQHARDFAAKCRKAAAWREGIIEEWGTMDAYLTATAKGRGRTRRGQAEPISSVVNSVLDDIALTDVAQKEGVG